jgi:flagellar biogenesis protein FliO
VVAAAPAAAQPHPAPPESGAALRALSSPPIPAPASSFSAGSLAAGLLLAGLTVAALVLARRKRRSSRRLVEVLESASLGPKRSLVVARMGDELLLIGSSEGGIALLSSQPASPLLGAAPLEAAPAEVAVERPALPGVAGAALGLIARLKGSAPAAPPAQAFEGLLTDSLEDVELRQKLSAGQAGMVR